jgi:hypothetical protein
MINGIRLKFDSVLLRIPDQEKIKHAILSILPKPVEVMPSGGVLAARGYESDGRIFRSATRVRHPQRTEIFEPFPTKPLSSGLGLPIVVISAHKGTIDYDDPKGTTFKSRSRPGESNTA